MYLFDLHRKNWLSAHTEYSVHLQTNPEDLMAHGLHLSGTKIVIVICKDRKYNELFVV